MAGSDLTKDIKYVDTGANIYTTTRQLGKIVWSEMTSGHQLIIKDASGGKVLYQVTAGLNNDQFWFDFEGYISKLRVDAIGSGVLMIYPYMG